jgi:crotonobetainyl-CoA:carnitine CoA-transferase CaiB-like acyl-CoA transferase
LALLGADVVKVERREGEDARRNPQSREWAARNQAPSWQAINLNKRSLTLDLQKPEAIAILKKLVAEADVVTENFRPGVMQRLGLGYEVLSEINPRLIYCSVSGFGHTGPDSKEPGYDGRIQAMSGIMAMTGHPGGDPLRAGFAVCDVLSGMTEAFAIASALFQRTHTGRGQKLDVSMLESTMAFLSGQVADWTVGGAQQKQWGNQAVSRRATANLFKARDGFVLLAANNDKQYDLLMKALGLTRLYDDPRFADWFLRLENQADLRAELEAVLTTDDAANWEERLTAVGVPCARIWRVDEIIEHRQIKARDAIQEVETAWGPRRFATTGFRMAHGGARIDRPAPQLGAHTEEVLREAGYTEAEIGSFRTSQVI